MEDLLRFEDHLDVTLVLEDGEIHANKFVLGARADYFSSMFRANNFKEANGNVKFPCRKVIMEQIIRLLYGGNLDCSKMTIGDKVELYNTCKMMTLHQRYGNIEEDIFYNPVKTLRINNADSLVAAAKILEATLMLELDISKKIVDYIGVRLNANNVLEKYFVLLPKSVVTALEKKWSLPLNHYSYRSVKIRDAYM